MVLHIWWVVSCPAILPMSFALSKSSCCILPLCWISHSFFQESHLYCLLSYLGPELNFLLFVVVIVPSFVFSCKFSLKLLSILKYRQLIYFSCISAILLSLISVIEALWDFGVPNWLCFSYFCVFLCCDLYIYWNTSIYLSSYSFCLLYFMWISLLGVFLFTPGNKKKYFEKFWYSNVIKFNWEHLL